MGPKKPAKKDEKVSYTYSERSITIFVSIGG